RGSSPSGARVGASPTKRSRITSSRAPCTAPATCRRGWAATGGAVGRAGPGSSDSGCLKAADTIDELAGAIGVASDGLSDTVRRHNEFARTGIDADFGKGGNVYDRNNGDPAHAPNPCLGPIER